MPASIVTTSASSAPSNSAHAQPNFDFLTPPTDIPHVDLADAMRTVLRIFHARLWILLTTFKRDPDTHLSHTDYSIICRVLNHHRPKRGEEPSATYLSAEAAFTFIVAARLARFRRERAAYDAIPTLIARMNSKLLSIATRRGCSDTSDLALDRFAHDAADTLIAIVHSMAASQSASGEQSSALRTEVAASATQPAPAQPATKSQQLPLPAPNSVPTPANDAPSPPHATPSPAPKRREKYIRLKFRQPRAA